MSKIEKDTRNGERKFDININISPIPQNCYECPFFYNPSTSKDEDMGFDLYRCFIADIDSYWGCAIDRPTGCPIDVGYKIHN